MIYFNERLKQLRKERNMTQKHLADLLNVSKSTISGYEAGTYQPSFEKLIQLADIFNVSLDYFYINLRMPRAEYKNGIRVPVIAHIPPNTNISKELSDLSDATPLDILYFRNIPPKYTSIREYFIFAKNKNFYLIHIQPTYAADDTVLACAAGQPAELYTPAELAEFNSFQQIGIVVDC